MLFVVWGEELKKTNSLLQIRRGNRDNLGMLSH